MPKRSKTPIGVKQRSDSEVGQRRLVRRCHCSYQQEKAWGYHLWKWVGGRASWKALGSATHVEDVAKYADSKKLKTILIKCNGCGAEMLREYAANAEPIRGRD